LYFWLIVCVWPIGVGRANEVGERFLREAPKAWDELRHLAYQMQAFIKFTDRDLDPNGNGMREVVSSFHYNGKSNNLLTEELILSGNKQGRQVIRCVNPEYSFKAEKDTSSSALLVKLLGPPINLAALPTGGDPPDVLQRILRRSLEMPLFMNYTPVTDVVAGPSFRVTDAAITSVDGEQLVQISFESEDKFEGKFTYRKGRMLLDSNRLYAIRKLICFCVLGEPRDTTEPPMRIAIQNSYSSNIGGFPALRSSVAEFSNVAKEDVGNLDATPTQQQVVASLKCDYEGFALGDIEPNKCVLSAFGLPEPPSGPATKTWLICVNLLVVITLTITILIRRKSAMKQARV
jgi:hypothetical protein